ncbi:hypothetical protein L198_06591 [Cryptococcus wingfieldii CBS 7118]|uniref:RRM domain-containing protein n=1 Tax=Cryptococcus wingfieldii CBS 7118 TaxID=1295528 RepID=A0A1E3IJK6_9TREE|nr:hypothetical protein L198_06591 [Cryptococcus wingfieldii CBS 7118]ODN88789.1 hypothetical protein L198_06591 [Cryptococcus wingfieldii CBS 7118]
MATQDQVTKRLHISGLKPEITAAHLRDRFSLFGSVSDVEELQPDALGDPRPFTYLTLQTTPAQLKRCLNTMSGSHWRGALLRIAEAKPKFDARLHAMNNPAPEIVDKKIEQKRKRVMRARAEGVGKLAQDMYLVDAQRATKKKFWVVVEDGGETRVVRPMCMRPDRPIGVPGKKIGLKKRAMAPARSFRKVINPLKWGSSLSTFPLSFPTSIGEGEWEFEGFSDEEEEEDEDGRVPIGVWRKVVDSEVVDEEVVRGKKRRVESDGMDFDYGIDLALDDFAVGSTASTPLFGHRELPTGRESSPLFPSHREEREASPLFPSHQQEREISPLFTSRAPPAEEADEEEVEAKSSPLFASRAVEASVEPEESSSAESSPLFPTRDLPRSANPSPSTQAARSSRPPSLRLDTPISSSPEPELEVTVPTTTRLPTPPPSSLPKPLVHQAKQEKTAALSVLDGLLDSFQVSPEREKLGRDSFRGFLEESDSEEDGEVEIGRGKKKEKKGVPAESVVEKDEEIVVEEPDLAPPPQEATEPSDSSEGSSSSSSGSDESSEDEKMDVDKPAGDDKKEESGDDSSEGSSEDSSEESGSGSGSGSSSGSGDDSSDDSSDSSSSDSDSDSDSESDSDDSSDDSESDSDEPAKPPAVDQPAQPSTLKSMFAPAPATTSTSLFGLPSSTPATNSAGFSLLANLAPDVELDDDFDIPLPSISGPSRPAQGEDELQPLPMVAGGRGKVKLDLETAGETPLFFTLPGDREGAEREKGRKKGESRNGFNELFFGLPKPEVEEAEEGYGGRGGHGARGGQTQGGFGQGGDAQGQGWGQTQDSGYRTRLHPSQLHPDLPEGEEPPILGFFSQPREDTKAMKALWEGEKAALTQGWKRRHREARKMRRRKGGEEGD